MDVLDLINRLGTKENTLTQRVFVSPVFNNTTVVTLIDGLVHRLKIPPITPGWYQIQPTDLKTAKIMKEADLADIEGYLKHLKKIRLVILQKEKDFHLAISLKNNSIGLDMATPIPVYLVSDFTEQFDTIIAGYDGINFWYWENDPICDPTRSEYLRECLGKEILPSMIRFKGLTLEEKLAYSLCHALIQKNKEMTKEGLLRKDVEHAGGQFVKFSERKDHYSVTYKVDGQKYTSYVTKDATHSVLTAGICLSGKDRHFDLASLITVLREGQRRGLIHRYDNTEE